LNQSLKTQGYSSNTDVAQSKQLFVDQNSMKSQQKRGRPIVQSNHFKQPSDMALQPSYNFHYIGCEGLSSIDDVTFGNCAVARHAGGCCRFSDVTCNCSDFTNSSGQFAANGLQPMDCERYMGTDVKEVADFTTENRPAALTETYGVVSATSWSTVQPHTSDGCWPSKYEYAEETFTDAAYDWSQYIWNAAVRAARVNYRGSVPLNMLKYTYPVDQQASTDANCCNYHQQPPIGSGEGLMRTSRLSVPVLHASQTNNLTSAKRDFCCHRCSRRFASSSDYRRHLVVHTGEKRFRCPRCDVRFSLKHNMVRHLRHIHRVNSTDL
jgi:uncharacterized C2H2 Zn-finger protein